MFFYTRLKKVLEVLNIHFLNSYPEICEFIHKMTHLLSFVVDKSHYFSHIMIFEYVLLLKLLLKQVIFWKLEIQVNLP